MIQNMWDTSGRLIRLLTLLQRRREWNASELGEELEVTTRTVRRDVVRLRDLGYPVATTYGNGGGYQLEAGASIPPLMFEAEEAVSTVLALRALAAGPGDASSGSLLTALDKLTRVMPPRLRATIAALSERSTELDLGTMMGPPAPVVDVKVLVALSRASREEHRIHCTYRRGNVEEERRLEPLHLVKTLGKWYLIAYCLDREAWRTFRIDRLAEIEITDTPTRRRPPPSDELNDYVKASVQRGYQQVTATVRIHAAKDAVAHVIAPAWGTITEESPGTCLAEVGAESHEVIARWLLLLDAPITVVGPPGLSAAFEALAERCREIAALPYSPGARPK